jgi:hypothetical protein
MSLLVQKTLIKTRLTDDVIADKQGTFSSWNYNYSFLFALKALRIASLKSQFRPGAASF